MIKYNGNTEAKVKNEFAHEDLSDDQLPIFPLNLVLFPGNLLPLHIFEPRYRKMINFCLEKDRDFGVVLIKRGKEIGENAEPYSIGTAVKIIEHNRFDDGRLNILTLGQYRFEIVELDRDHDRLYLVAKVRTPSSGPRFGSVRHKDNYLDLIADSARRLYRHYETLLEQTTPDWDVPEEIPISPNRLACQIGTRLQIPLEAKQELLEILPIDQLLRREIRLLQSESQRLTAVSTAQEKFSQLYPDRKGFWKDVPLN